MLLKSLDPVRFIPCRNEGGNPAMRCDLYAGGGLNAELSEN